jgi:protein involved in sex pheromone biosynthesis
MNIGMTSLNLRKEGKQISTEIIKRERNMRRRLEMQNFMRNITIGKSTSAQISISKRTIAHSVAEISSMIRKHKVSLSKDLTRESVSTRNILLEMKSKKKKSM